jgi:hypothetical protein
VLGSDADSRTAAKTSDRTLLGDKAATETDGYYANAWERSYAVLVPWEVVLPLGPPEGLALVPRAPLC